MSSKRLSSTVEIKLDGESYQLVPTLKAASAISRQFGGFLGAFQALQNGSLEVVQFILRQGIATRHISSDDLNEKAWRNGVLKLTGPLTKYVIVLQNGGRDPDEHTDDEEEEAEGNDHA